MISVVLPCYNEESAILECVNSIKKDISKSEFEYEIIIVDDGSTDASLSKIIESGATYVTHPHNLGYGSALKTGIKKSKFDTILILDIDGSYPTKHIPDLLKIYLESKNSSTGLDMLVGARKGKVYDGSSIKFFFRKFLKFLVEWTTGRKIIDINSGMRIFSKKTINTFLPQLCNTFSFTTSLTLAFMLTGKFVKYHSIEYNVRTGKSHVRIFRDSLRTLQYIIEAIIYYNPLKLFLLLFLVFAFISIFFLTFYLIYGTIVYLTLFCLIAFFSLVSILFGFLMELIRQKINLNK
tara:strand:+ start:489 stop:1370 length:882 start_codon:yes stop_codon:yes gene_type:complete